MTTIQVTAVDSFVHGTLNVHKGERLELPETAARDLMKAGLLREGHSGSAAAPAAAPAAPKPANGKRQRSNKAAGPSADKAGVPGDQLESAAAVEQPAAPTAGGQPEAPSAD